MSMKHPKVLLFFALLAACAPLSTSTPFPTLHIVEIGMTPALRPWQLRFNQCAQQIPGITLVFYEASQADQLAQLSNHDFFVQLGSDIPADTFATQLGIENMVWIIHADNPLSQITSEQLTLIFEGKSSTWMVAGETAEGFNFPIAPWVYDQNDALYLPFQAMVWGQRAYPPQANLAPDPAAMLEAVSADPGAIGFVPESWLNGQQQTQSNPGIIQVMGQNGLLLNEQPVVAVAMQEPAKQSRDVLLCVGGSFR